MRKLGEEITELLDGVDKYKQYIVNGEGKDLDTEWYNKIRVQKLKCKVRKKVNELLILLNDK